MPPEYNILPPNIDIKPPSDNRFKILISVCILVLIISFINTIRIKEQTAATTKTAAITASNNSTGIDSSFFNFNQPQTPATLAAHQSSVPIPQSASSPHAQTSAPVNIITADSYLVGNLATGKIYFEKDTDDRATYRFHIKTFYGYRCGKAFGPECDCDCGKFVDYRI